MAPPTLMGGIKPTNVIKVGGAMRAFRPNGPPYGGGPDVQQCNASKISKQLRRDGTTLQQSLQNVNSLFILGKKFESQNISVTKCKEVFYCCLYLLAFLLRLRKKYTYSTVVEAVYMLMFP